MAKPSPSEYDEFFHDAHRQGAKRHRNLWLQANEFLLMKAKRLGFDASTKANRALLSVIALSVLDSAKVYYEGKPK